jgi:hypothetical protein
MLQHLDPDAHAARQGEAQVKLPIEGVRFQQCAEALDLQQFMGVGNRPGVGSRGSEWRWPLVLAGEHHRHDPLSLGRVA